jgi:AcrR family transcriptional regulator
LLDAAEELFATFGVEGVSIRSINAAAGFGSATVHRHFHSKDQLLDAVIRRRIDAVTARQTELLAPLAADVRTPTALDLVEAYTVPLRELIKRDGVGAFRWLQVLARLVLAQDPRLIKLSSEAGTTESFTRALRRVFPGVPIRQLGQGVGIALGTLVQMLANRDIWIARGVWGKRTGRSADVDMLVRFVASGLAEMMAAPRQRPSRRTRRCAKPQRSGR